MYCKQIKFLKPSFLKINIKLTVGLIKAAPKLNLTLAPLNINTNNLLTEFNQYLINTVVLEDKYLIDTNLVINKTYNNVFLLIKKLNYICFLKCVRNFKLNSINSQIFSMILYYILNTFLIKSEIIDLKVLTQYFIIIKNINYKYFFYMKTFYILNESIVLKNLKCFLNLNQF